MARSPRTSGAPDIEKALKEFIEQAANRQIVRAFGTSSPAAELREMRKALTRLERRVDQLATRASGRPRRAAGSRRGPGRPPTHTTCTVEGCNNPHYAKGLCSRCYQRARRNEARDQAIAAHAASARRTGSKKTQSGGSKASKKKAAKKASKKASKKSGRRATTGRSSKRRTARKTGQS